MNPGKEFEIQWKNSIPPEIYYHRIHDPAQSFHTEKANLRFSPQNPYDCFLYSFPLLFTLELKSTQGTSITFFKEDFSNDGKSHTFMIKRNQIQGLNHSAMFPGIVSGFILNFRRTEHTYFLDIKDFNLMSSSIGKKSFSESDVISHHGMLINQRLKRTRFSYDVEGFIEEKKKNMNNMNIIKEKYEKENA